MTPWRWLIGFLLVCVAVPVQAEPPTAFYAPKINGYRIWIGPDEALDWIDVCCKMSDSGELLWADYTPIEEITILRTTRGQVYITIKKTWSLWNLSFEAGNTTHAILKLIRPMERSYDETQ